MIRDVPQGKAEKVDDTAAEDHVEQGSQTFDKKIIHTGMSTALVSTLKKESLGI